MKSLHSPVRYVTLGAVGATLLLTIGATLSIMYTTSKTIRQPVVSLNTSRPAPPAPPEPPAPPVKKVPNKRRPPAAEERLFKRKSRVNYGQIFMGPLEVNLILRNLDNKNTYLEYGSGGSTYNYPKFVKHAVSIEHDRDWCEKVRGRLANMSQLAHVDYRCSYVDKGFRGYKTGGKTEGDYVIFKEYVDQVDEAGYDLYDIVLIDGRARVDCSIKVLSYITQDTPVFIHDSTRFFETDQYVAALEYYDIKDSIGGDGRQGIVLLKRKQIYENLQGNHTAVQDILNRKYNITTDGSEG